MRRFSACEHFNTIFFREMNAKNVKADTVPIYFEIIKADKSTS